ncbi:unnamed protein product, partial [Pylaiella littoralis]
MRVKEAFLGRDRTVVQGFTKCTHSTGKNRARAGASAFFPRMNELRAGTSLAAFSFFFAVFFAFGNCPFSVFCFGHGNLIDCRFLPFRFRARGLTQARTCNPAGWPIILFRTQTYPITDVVFATLGRPQRPPCRFPAFIIVLSLSLCLCLSLPRPLFW